MANFWAVCFWQINLHAKLAVLFLRLSIRGAQIASLLLLLSSLSAHSEICILNLGLAFSGVQLSDGNNSEPTIKMIYRINKTFPPITTIREARREANWRAATTSFFESSSRVVAEVQHLDQHFESATWPATTKLLTCLTVCLSALCVHLNHLHVPIPHQEWTDHKLKWEPSEYGGIKEMNVPAEQIWLPDIVLYNRWVTLFARYLIRCWNPTLTTGISAEGYFSVSIMTKAKVRFDGHVSWNPPAIFRSSCQIDITFFPFDSQNCHLKFGSVSLIWVSA